MTEEQYSAVDAAIHELITKLGALITAIHSTRPPVESETMDWKPGPV